jgi:FXSXX-COOH protein
LIVAGRQAKVVFVDWGPPAEEAQPEWRSPMIDVSGMSLSDLAAAEGDSALARSLRRLAEDLARPEDPIAGFNSAL